jgi:hypothetical protein
VPAIKIALGAGVGEAMAEALDDRKMELKAKEP